MSVTTHLLHRARLLMEAGKLEDANKILDSVLHAEPDNADALLLKQRFLQTLWTEPAAPPKAPEEISPRKVEQAKQMENYKWYVVLLGVALLTTFFGFTYLMYVDGKELRTVSAEKAALIREYNALAATHSDLNQQHDDQTTRFQNLIAEHETLNEIYTAVQDELSVTRAELSQLTRRYENLVAQYNELNGRYTALEQDHNNLTTSYNTLQGNYTYLQQQYNSLSAIALTPPYIHVTGERTIDLVFYRSSGSIDRWTVPFDTLEYNLERGRITRAEIKDNYIKRLENENGDVSTVVDFRPFVDSYPFRQVVDSVYYGSRNDDEFIRELWFITTQLANYNEEFGEHPRYALETFLAGGGDCEDTAILLASMLRAAPVNWRIGLYYMDTNSPQHPINPNHVMVRVQTGTREYLIETTNNQHMEPYQSISVKGWDFWLGEG
jgi:uncharacterized protein YdcH (DUF465 family)